MAMADYRRCDCCGAKAFYDADLRYDFEEWPETGLSNVGRWVVLCRDCAPVRAALFITATPEQMQVAIDLLRAQGIGVNEEMERPR